jgi:hypothetical protein
VSAGPDPGDRLSDRSLPVVDVAARADVHLRLPWKEVGSRRLLSKLP